MRLIKPYIVLEDEIDSNKIMKSIEKAGRTCYKSENLINEDSAEKFIKILLKKGHESVIEHEKITVRIVCDRGVSHEIVRHRLASYSQESTRYCNYCQDKFGSELTFIIPCFWKETDKEYKIWEQTMQFIENEYNKLIESGAKPEQARAILPNSLKTEIVVTMNLRAWRHFLKLRTDNSAHPQIREISTKILFEFKNKLPILFGDI